MDKFIIESCPNFRDLGGIPLAGGNLTKTGKIFRSDCLSKLSTDEISRLKENELTCIIDLRSESEAAVNVNPLAKTDGFNYYNIPLLDQLNSALMSARMDENFDKDEFKGLFPDNMGDLYISLIDNSQKDIARIFKIIAANKDCGIVFHCTAGKDRTGVISALILMLVGSSEKEIIDNYAETYENTKGSLKEIMQIFESIGAPLHILRSDPEFIEKFITHLKEKYDNAESYLLGIGVTRQEIEDVKSLLIS